MDIGRTKGGAALALYDVGSREKASLYGVLTIDDSGRVTDFVEKPTDPPTSLISTACYYFAPGAVAAKTPESEGRPPAAKQGVGREWQSGNSSP